MYIFLDNRQRISKIASENKKVVTVTLVTEYLLTKKQ